jgi:hypothetical protein
MQKTLKPNKQLFSLDKKEVSITEDESGDKRYIKKEPFILT